MRPERIVRVLREIDADIIALQEVLSVPNHTPEHDQARYIADRLGLHYYVGGTRVLKGGTYGNVLLSRFPLRATENYDISVRGREQRGCLRADVELEGVALMHVFNVHLGTAFLERRHQGRRLIDSRILNNEDIRGPRILLGDFNEWTRGLASRLLAWHLKSADVKLHLPRAKTYPGVLPFLHLDHIYYEHTLDLLSMSLHKSRTALVASDHLPLVAELKIPAK